MLLPKFIHLRNQTEYSLCKSTISPKNLASLAADNLMPAVAMTDSHNLFGSLEFSLAAQEKGIQPIIGSAVKLMIDDKIYDLPLLAKSEVGYQNLLKLISRTNIEKEFYEPESHASIELLASLSKDLICLSGGYEGCVGRMLINNQNEKARSFALQLKSIFADDFYIEITRCGSEVEEIIESELINIALEQKIPLVATNMVCFQNSEMHEAMEILLSIGNGTYISDQNREKVSRERYFKSQNEMVDLFSDIPEALENSVNIAMKCCFMPKSSSLKLPKFLTDTDDSGSLSELEYLKSEARKGLEIRLDDKYIIDKIPDSEKASVRQKYFERLEFELDIIIKMDFAGYFLIVSDFIQWSKRNNIPVGPGRGSGVGSVVAWSLQITDLDPIRFGLLFERFLNPQRISMPDFDVDFCQSRRDEVIDYVRQKYGKDFVGQIITFGKLQARAVLKDVGRVLQMSYNQVDAISKLVPFNPVDPVDLQQAIDMDANLRDEIDSNLEVKRLVDLSLKLEGLTRHCSTHAAGIVISGVRLNEIVALTKDDNSDIPVISYGMKYAELAGLVKFDFLGLKTLTVIHHASDLIMKRFSNFDIGKIPLNDEKTFKMLSEGDSMGVFQLESSGMRTVLRKMQADKIEDIIALISLYRPGPMDNIPTYIDSKLGRIKVEYPHELLKDVLSETYGVIVYQEQVMEIAKILAGYSLGDADLLRRAMGKKIKSEMDQQREIFTNGAKKNNINSDLAGEIFDLVAKFAGYGFNKSHAAAYAMISYRTAYLKAHYPVEFIVASMIYDIGDANKIGKFCQMAIERGIKILPPDINKSEALFSIEAIYDATT